MPRSKEISLALRNQAVGLSKAGKSCRITSNMLGINYLSVYYILKKFRQTGSTINMPRAGRPKSISLRASRYLKSIIKSKRRTGLTGITRLFNLSRDVPISKIEKGRRAFVYRIINRYKETGKVKDSARSQEIDAKNVFRARYFSQFSPRAFFLQAKKGSLPFRQD